MKCIAIYEIIFGFQQSSNHLNAYSCGLWICDCDWGVCMCMWFDGHRPSYQQLMFICFHFVPLRYNILIQLKWCKIRLFRFKQIIINLRFQPKNYCGFVRLCKLQTTSRFSGGFGLWFHATVDPAKWYVISNKTLSVCHHLRMHIHITVLGNSFTQTETQPYRVFRYSNWLNDFCSIDLCICMRACPSAHAIISHNHTATPPPNTHNLQHKNV